MKYDSLFKKTTSTAYGIVVLFLLAVAVNILASKANIRFDLTGDKLFTLSDGTKKLLKNLDGEVEVKFYYSQSLKETPALIKNYSSRVEELLFEYADLSSHKIKIEVIDPKPDTDEEEWARKFGISGIALQQGDELFMGAVFLKGKNEYLIPYFDPRREEFLEYDLSEALVRVTSQQNNKIGLFTSLNVWGNPVANQPAWALVSELQKASELINLNENFTALDTLQVAILLHPKGLTESQIYKLDQFLVKGGRLILLLDPYSRADLAEASQSMDPQQLFSYVPKSELITLTNAWGIAFNSVNIVGDMRYASQISTGGAQFDYPFFLNLGPDSFSKEHILTNQLTSFLFAEGGSIILDEKSPYKLEALIETSLDSGELEPKMLQYIGPQSFSQGFKPDGKKRTLAGVLSGKFTSAFPQAPSGETIPHEPGGEKEGAVLLVADVDFLHDNNSIDRMRFGGQVIMRPRNGNLTFFLSATEYLGGREELISIRSRGKMARPFTRMQDLQREASERWKNAEEELSQKISELQNKINNMQQERTDGNKLVSLTPQQQEEIARFRDQEVEFRKKRREVRKNLREDIEKLQNRIILANMFVVPISVVAIGGLFVLQRRRRRDDEI